MKTMEASNKFLIIVDGAYFSYFTLFGAVAEFQKRFPDEASIWLKPIDECDQSNLPDLLNCANFKKILKEYVMKRLETVDEIAKQNFQQEIDLADRIDILFTMEDKLTNSFRLQLYPQYKQQRAAAKKQFKVSSARDYIVNVLFKELDVEGNYGYKTVKVDGAEGDDIIATALLKLKDQYANMMLIASDRDFLQIDDIKEFDLYGKELKCILGDEEVSADDFLLGKILMGDKSDNIKQVIFRCGPKTALKWTKDKAALKRLLKENQSYFDRYQLNEKMISFKKIPEELSNKILEKLNETLYKNDVLNKKVSLKDFMAW